MTTSDITSAPDRHAAGPRGEIRSDRVGDEVLLEPVPGGVAEAVGLRFRTHRPIVCATVLWLFGYLLLSGVLVGIGLLLTHELLGGGLGRWDESVSRWFVVRRTGTLDSITAIGSALGSTVVIIGVAAISAVALAIGRHWRQIGLLAYALTLEFTVFLTATLVVDRPRPFVPRLDPSPPTSSYPSGHTAAALVLYVVLAIVISSLVRSRATRVLVWVLAVALPVMVGLSRLYRGMHHVTDVAASIILGIGVVLMALLTTRAAVAVSTARDHPVALRSTMESPDEAEVAS